MSFAAKLRRAPGRIAAGLFILNSGLGKFSADEQTSRDCMRWRSRRIPYLAKVEPKLFVKMLAVAETTVGAALRAPIVPAGLAGCVWPDLAAVSWVSTAGLRAGTIGISVPRRQVFRSPKTCGWLRSGSGSSWTRR